MNNTLEQSSKIGHDYEAEDLLSDEVIITFIKETKDTFSAYEIAKQTGCSLANIDNIRKMPDGETRKLKKPTTRPMTKFIKGQGIDKRSQAESLLKQIKDMVNSVQI